MRFIDLRKIQEKTGVIAFCGPSVLEHNINFELNERNITKGQLISLEMIEEHCKKSYLEVIIDAIIEGRSGLPGIQRILTSNNSLFKEIDFFIASGMRTRTLPAPASTASWYPWAGAAKPCECPPIINSLPARSLFSGLLQIIFGKSASLPCLNQ